MKTLTSPKTTAILLALCFALCLAFMAGCSHNASTYSDGVGMETTFRPDSGNFGLVFRYGKIWNLVARENTEAEMNGSNDLSSAGSAIPSTATSTDGKLKIKIGPQTTGYEAQIVEALKDNPAALAAYYDYKLQALKQSASSTTDSASSNLNKETPK